MEEIKQEETLQYLKFKMGEEQYGINVISIREVLNVPQITKVPGMPVFFSGVINLRGNVVPVIDLKQKLDIGATVITLDTSIIVIEIENQQADNYNEKYFEVGIFSDNVQKVIDLNKAEIEPVPQFGLNINDSFLDGLGRQNHEFIILLNINRILTTEEQNDVMENLVKPSAMEKT